jgi:septum formation protein
MTVLTLASASMTRALLLRNAGVTIDVAPAGVDEDALKAALLAEAVSVRDIADALAEAKAVRGSLRRQGLVLGADQTLEHDGRLLDKPQGLEQARRQLQDLRGGPHRLHTAAVIADENRPVWRCLVSATLTMRSFSEAFLDHYLATEGEALLSCVGAYRLEGLGAQLFERIEGDYFSILGLPLLPILQFLRMRGLAPS